MKQQHIKQKVKSGPTIIDERKNIAPPDVDLTVVNQPVRTVLYVEVGDMERRRVQMLLDQLNQAHSTARGGIHYLIPVRNGRITSDAIFEGEILKMVEQICEVRDGKIVLKEDAKDVHIVRQAV